MTNSLSFDVQSVIAVGYSNDTTGNNITFFISHDGGFTWRDPHITPFAKNGTTGSIAFTDGLGIAGTYPFLEGTHSPA